ncbi:polysaccharide deacetylase family protein [Spongiactinospora sp. TRM90649]|uniref:polysaccharide deacetylase family protein n=1 Tax=Spongiactinospora sp. TRM90649 TaxID=3031114 RepID=UPI0023F89AE1|nr:polysaccharide deacetylase family protein [Spongiactinospora sp. TRM90649]MDF5759262.1 polysaccharide deacetylase family protein [Spongiactinospora sp. TRM90649]
MVQPDAPAEAAPSSSRCADAGGCSRGAAARAVLAFDDGLASQAEAVRLLRGNGLTATFYIPSGLLGRTGRMTPAQVRDLAKAGHEIGGHTLTHARLPDLPPDARRRQLCDDRTALRTLTGQDVRSVAYPYDASDPATTRIARSCGYQHIRPKAPLTVLNTTTLTTLRHHATRGGTFVFHDICPTACGRYSIDRQTLKAFLTWLAQSS